MNEQLQGALADLIQRTTTGVDAAADFLAAELPEVIHQLLLWHAMKSGFFFLFGLVLTLCFFLIAKAFHRAVKEENENEDFQKPWFWELGGGFGWLCAFLVTAGCMLIWCNLDWLQILIAPKVWLLEYAATLAK